MKLLDVHLKAAGYNQSEAILRDIDFSIGEGELVGLIGPNGAGKSTTIKSILGLLKDVDGRVDFLNDGNYSYIPERPFFYEELTLWEHLDLAASIMSIGDKEFRERAEKLIRQFKMEGAAHKLPNTFSKGMQQKMMLITAFLLKPSIYIVDEPFIGLDPRAMKDFLAILFEEKENGAGILMSTHVLDTAEKICDRFLLIAGGRQMAYGTLDEIREQSGLLNGSLFDCFNLLSGDEPDDRP